MHVFGFLLECFLVNLSMVDDFVYTWKDYTFECYPWADYLPISMLASIETLPNKLLLLSGKFLDVLLLL